MNDFAERLNSLRRDGQSTLAFARDLEIGDSLLRQYLGGAMPRLDKLLQIAKATGVSINWLATGEGGRDSRVETSHVPVRTEQEQTGEPMQIIDPSRLDGSPLIWLPMLDVSAAAGSGRLSPEFPEVRGYVALGEEYLRSIGVPPRFARLLEIRGDSMAHTLRDRDVAVVDTSITDVQSDAVYAVVYGGLVVTKRIQLNRDGSLVLSSDNKSAGYRDERIAPGDLHELHIAGRVKGRVGSM